ncbi:hypothetical protein D920_00978 [Enterococcus faecalis 13-SD-W-01]|nr:hypothetical protein D920_00978 [Enterococcus faecalis 13-SD-W-01]
MNVMLENQNPIFDYHKEPSRDILCIDCKSFYASVECVERGLNPLKTKLVLCPIHQIIQTNAAAA